MAVETIRDAVLASLDEQRLVALTQELIRLDTSNPPGNEQVVADFIASYLGKLGLATQMQMVRPGRANVLARLGLPGARPHLILNGHTDTVPAGEGWTFDPHGGLVQDGRLYGRGASDMKGGLAAMIAAVEAVVRSKAPLRGSLTLAAVMDEEEDQEGTSYAVKHGLRGDIAIVGEPTELLPVIAHKGDAYIEVVTQGIEAHASTPQAGVNAIDQMADVIVELRSLAESLEARVHPIVGPPTLTVSTIHGGITSCTVPGVCRVTIDRRVVPGEDPEEVADEVRAAVKRVEGRRADLRATVRLTRFAPPMEIAANLPVVEAIRAATADVLGQDPGVHGWSAFSDANILVGEAATPTVVFGPGSISKQAHRADESVGIDELVAGAKIYALTILRLLC